MEERNVKISLQTAKEWYKNDTLKEVALQAFTEEELTHKDYRNIKSFADAYCYLKNNHICADLTGEYCCTPKNSYTEKICKYRIIVAALTNNEKRNLTTGERWFPIVQFCRLGEEKNCLGNKIIGTIESEGQKYTVVGSYAYYGSNTGLGYCHSNDDLSHSNAVMGFRSVSSKEVAEHISKYFGRLLFDIHYGGTNCDWKWID